MKGILSEVCAEGFDPGSVSLLKNLDMTSQYKTRFILIDDDALNNGISGIIIKVALPSSEICAFTAPDKGMEFIRTEYAELRSEYRTVLLLDINMPGMSA